MSHGTRADALGMSIEYVVGDVNAMSFPDDSFDGSRVERVLQYVDDPHAALSEMVRVTMPGGHVVASELDWDMFVMNIPRSRSPPFSLDERHD